MIKQHFLINCYQKGIQIWLAICYQIALYVNHRKAGHKKRKQSGQNRNCDFFGKNIFAITMPVYSLVFKAKKVVLYPKRKALLGNFWE